MKAKPILSIIIVSFNTKELLKQTIRSIQRTMNNEQGTIEIIVIDNNSSDGSAEMVRKEFKKVKLIVSSKNLGFAKANNLGAKTAAGRYLLFLNSDTIVKPNALKEMIEFCEQNPQIGILGPKLILKNGRIQPYCIGYTSSLNQVFKNRLARILLSLKFSKKVLTKFSLEYYNWLKPRQVDWVTGAALMIRKNLFDKLRGFDKRIFMYFEDQDLCLRVKNLGDEVWVFPQAKIIHLGGKSIKMDKKRKKHYYQSQDYFFKKHFGLISFWLMKILSFPLRFFELRSKN